MTVGLLDVRGEELAAAGDDVEVGGAELHLEELRAALDLI